jgi:hypothetical protein
MLGTVFRLPLGVNRHPIGLGDGRNAQFHPIIHRATSSVRCSCFHIKHGVGPHHRVRGRIPKLGGGIAIRIDPYPHAIVPCPFDGTCRLGEGLVEIRNRVKAIHNDILLACVDLHPYRKGDAAPFGNLDALVKPRRMGRVHGEKGLGIFPL